MINGILHGLRRPEYVHVLLNPLPVYGLAMGLICLFVAVCQRSRSATTAGLVLVIISSAAAWPVYEYGQQAYDRVLSMADEAGRTWLEAHKSRGETLIWFFYALAILSVIALIVSIKWPGSSVWLGIIILVLGLVVLGAGGYIAYAGGKIRHPEFRTGPSPAQSAAPATGNVAPGIQPSESAGPAAAKVTIRTFQYSPATIEIKKGETAEWINSDLTPHTVTSQGNDNFNSGSIEPGASWRHTFSDAGTFPYFCKFHDEMKGTVVVK